MALQINQYTKIRTNLTLDNDDLMDLDSTDDAGVSYESAKMTVANLLAFVNANAVNIYIADGTIGGNRTLTANGNWTKWLLGDVKVANVGDGNSFGFVVEFGVLEMGRFNYDVPSTSANIELKHLILGVPTTYLNASNGLVDIIGDLKITDGLQALNKVFTSDANGLGSWQYPIVGSGGIYGGDGTIPTNTIATLTDVLSFMGGFVGIGTATPTKELEVNGDIIAGNTELTSQFGAALFGYKGYGATNFAIIQDASGLTGINAPTGQPIEMRINNSVKYSVIGGEFRGNSDLGMKIGVFQGTVGLGVQTNLLEFINPAITSDFTFGYGTSGSLTKQMTILGTGEVGIGTTTPTSKLNVKGGTPSTAKTLLIENSLLNPNLVVQDDGFIGIGTATQLADETLRVFGKMTTSNVVSFGGANTIGSSINTPTGWRLILGGLSVFTDDVSNNSTTIRSRNSTFRVNGDNVTSYFEVSNPADKSTTAHVIARTVTSVAHVGDSIYKMTSSYWDGAAGQTKVGDMSLISNNTTGDTKLKFNVAGTDIVSMLDSGNVGIGTTTPNASAKLEIESTTQGFLKPRMTTVQRDAVLTPTAGLEVYNTTTNKMNFYNGSAWEAITSA